MKRVKQKKTIFFTTDSLPFIKTMLKDGLEPPHGCPHFLNGIESNLRFQENLENAILITNKEKLSRKI